jgi:hypothetical protein
MRLSETYNWGNFRDYFIRSSSGGLFAKIAASVGLFFELVLNKMFIEEHFEKNRDMPI